MSWRVDIVSNCNNLFLSLFLNLLFTAREFIVKYILDLPKGESKHKNRPLKTNTGTSPKGACGVI
jgi:hypothetical protein